MMKKSTLKQFAAHQLPKCELKKIKGGYKYVPFGEVGASFIGSVIDIRFYNNTVTTAGGNTGLTKP